VLGGLVSGSVVVVAIVLVAIFDERIAAAALPRRRGRV
jgi:hypothetical protein